MADGSAEDSALQALLNGGDADLTDAPAADLQDSTVQHEDEDDEYDPSALVPDTTTYEENAAPLISTPAVEPPSQVPSRAASAKPAPAAPPSKPRTIGGFAVDDSSDEEDVKPATPVTNGTSNVAETAPQPTAAENISQPQAPLPSASPALPEPHVSPSTSTAVQAQPVTGTAASPAPGVLPPSAPAAASVAAAPAPTAASPVSASASAKPAAPSPVQTSQPVPPMSAPSSAKTAKPVRLPNDRIGILEDRVEEDPRGDIEAWLQLVAEYRSKGRLDDARSTYNRFFQVFPHAADEWVNYTRMETEENNLLNVENIFRKTLMEVPHVKLWSAYLDYVRRQQNLTTDTSGNARATVAQTFEFVLNTIGIDRTSGQIWLDYIEFLKSAPGNVTGTNPDWRDLQKIDALRKAYQKAVVMPTQQTQTIWGEWTSFEMGLNKTAARKYLQERSTAYVTARATAVQLTNRFREIDRTTLPRLPPAPGFEGEALYLQQLKLWQEWIAYEKTDPLQDKDTDPTAYRNRILYTYKQALMALQFWPEMWYEAAEWCFLNDMEAEGTKFLSQGAEANPESLLLAFKRADRIEISSTHEDGEDALRKRGVAVREPYDKVLDALYDLIKKVKVRAQEANTAVQEALAQEAVLEEQPMADDEEEEQTNGDGLSQERKAQKAAEREAKLAAVKSVGEAQVDEVKKMITAGWIGLMRAMRRVQGKGSVKDANGIGGSRQIFADCRKKGNLTSDIYIVAGLMEHYAYKDAAGTKIFERGLKLHPEDEHLVLEYLKHLIAINDVTNARAVFEATISRLASKPALLHRAKPLLLFFHNYESQYGELSQIQKLEKRMADLFPDDPSLSYYRTFEARFQTENFDPMSARPIISPQSQARPRIMVTSIESLPGAIQHDSPHLGVGGFPSSPKRPLEHTFDSDNEGRPKKFARGESPLAGAAGRRLAAAKHGATPSVTGGMFPTVKPLPQHITFLLSVIPGAEHYNINRFSPMRMVELLRHVDLSRANVQRPMGI